MNILVLDIGRTHIKVCLVDERGRITGREETPNHSVRIDGIDAFDSEAIWHWFIQTLSQICRSWQPDAMVVTTHGACAALVSDSGLALPVMDYESGQYETVSQAYQALRDPYASTGSPALPNGLNLGKQIYWAERRFPDRFRQVRNILTWPQYWAWKLTGTLATERSSLGAHTDLWRPLQQSFSMLVTQRHWDSLFPPLRRAWDTLGTPEPTLAAETGLNPACRVLCGVHDSNAALVRHHQGKPVTLLSTGTWVIGLCAGSSGDMLNEPDDQLLNVSILGEPLPSFRFMGGREWEILSRGVKGDVSLSHLSWLIDHQVMALPSFSPQGGPFRNAPGSITGSCPTGQHRKALASLYCAQVTAWCLQRFQVRGDIIVDGPFVRDELFPGVLAGLLPACRVRTTSSTDGTAIGAARLAVWPESVPVKYATVAPLSVKGLDPYHQQWLKRLPGRPA